MRDPQRGDREASSLAHVAEKSPDRRDLRNQGIARCDGHSHIMWILAAERDPTGHPIQPTHFTSEESDKNS